MSYKSFFVLCHLVVAAFVLPAAHAAPTDYQFKMVVQKLAVLPTPGGMLSASTPQLDFNNVSVGSSSSIALSITNIGAQTLRPLKISVSNPFSYSVSHTCRTSIYPLESCSITVIYHPPVAGESSNVLNIVGDGSALGILLYGMGI